MEQLRNLLDLCRQYPEVKRVETNREGWMTVEFHERRPAVALNEPPFNLADSLPPDDVMLFAATEDIDELMKSRAAEPPQE
jgi:hypothetical protein